MLTKIQAVDVLSEPGFPVVPPNVISPSSRLKITVRGAVQGVGFRPFVFRLATELDLAGWVNNSPQGVFIEVEGLRISIEKFLLRLETEKPPRSFIQSLEASWLEPVGFKQFEIRESGTHGPKTALVLPDIGTCPDCLEDIFNRANRRHHYPFTNCTNCGPRFSIIESLPYDRANTSMKGFKMCPACQMEYDDPLNRRFHAQPNACPRCGPHLELWQGGAFPKGLHFVFDGVRACSSHRSEEALRGAAQGICRGQILAIKGMGGFHLMVDARNEEAVRKLRQRKHREEKPFALLFPTLEKTQNLCEVSRLEERLLRSPEAPIVLLKKNGKQGSEIADSIAPGNPWLGVMLPSNPIHYLLMAELGFPVVATSGNLSDEPICTDEDEALERLGEIADLFLVHNRPIVRHVDDSIVRVMLDREMVLRRARGYAPLPITLISETGRDPSQVVLAVGGHLKNSVALSVGKQVFISQHIGDLETAGAHAAFQQVIEDFKGLYEAKPQVIASDLHPEYLSTKFADEIARGRRSSSSTVAKVGVQHHLAHVFSCMAENELKPPLLGVSWDGTGYGWDGSIWGGEFFWVAEKGVKRVAHFRSFRLPGGDAAVKEPRRAAFGLLFELFGDKAVLEDDIPTWAAFSESELAALRTMLSRNIHSPLCCSVGRLFDAVASLIGLRQQTRFEGQAAMDLEFALEGVKTEGAYSLFPVGNRPPFVLDWSQMVKAILADLKGGVDAGEISARFHNALAEAVVKIAKRTGGPGVVLSGGCFQNRYLSERVVTRLREENFKPYWHQRVPPHDGGIALGQIVASLETLKAKINHVSCNSRQN